MTCPVQKIGGQSNCNHLHFIFTDIITLSALCVFLFPNPHNCFKYKLMNQNKECLHRIMILLISVGLAGVKLPAALGCICIRADMDISL